MSRRARIHSVAEAAEWADGCLLIDSYGAFLGRHSERLRLSLKGETLQERPLLGLEHVLVLSGGVSLKRRCCSLSHSIRLRDTERPAAARSSAARAPP